MRVVMGLLVATAIGLTFACARSGESSPSAVDEAEVVDLRDHEPVVSLQEQLEKSSTGLLIREIKEIERTDCEDKAITPEQCAWRIMRREEILNERCEAGEQGACEYVKANAAEPEQ